MNYCVWLLRDTCEVQSKTVKLQSKNSLIGKYGFKSETFENPKTITHLNNILNKKAGDNTCDNNAFVAKA